MSHQLRVLLPCLLLGVFLASYASPSTTFICSSWTGPADCGGHTWQVDAFPDIQAGIDAVAAGGTVHVAPGTYTALLQIAKPVTVTGPGGSGDPLVSAVLTPPSSATTEQLAAGFYTTNAYPVVVSGFILSAAYIAAMSGQ